MIKNNNVNFTSVIYKGDHIAKMYHGVDLVFQKDVEIKPNLVGSFKSNTSSSNCFWYLNSQKISLDKEFQVVVEEKVLEGNRYLSGQGSYNSIFSTAIERLEKFPDTSNITSMRSMFSGCSGLTYCNVLDFNTANVNNMAYMFLSCSGLTNINLSSFKTDAVTNMMSMFYDCRGLSELDVSSFNTKNVTSMTSMFYYCSRMTSLNLGENWDMNSVTASTANMFGYCNNLTKVTGTISNLKMDISLHNSSLTNESAMVFINGLAEVTSKHTITLKKDTYNTLSDDQKEIAVNKGWTIATV